MNSKNTRVSFLGLILLATFFVPQVVKAAVQASPQVSTIKSALYNWYRGGSQFQSSIEKLDTKPVKEFAVPVLHGVTLSTIVNNYGDERGGGTRIHEGLDIMAAEGTLVVTAVPAVVTRIGDGAASGLFVATANPGGETFVYMHLSKVADIKTGDVLKVGDSIGFVGHTGNAPVNSPHLHFEIRDEQGVPTDPMTRLKRVFTAEEVIKYSPTTMVPETITVLPIKTEIVVKDSVATKLSDVVIQHTITQTIKLGSKGETVMVLQKLLIKKKVGSATKITADGSFGPKSRQALIEYQKSVGLTADGVAGPKTLSYILTH